MKVAVVGSRGLSISNLEAYLPEDTTEIVSGGRGSVASDTVAGGAFFQADTFFSGNIWGDIPAGYKAGAGTAPAESWQKEYSSM